MMFPSSSQVFILCCVIGWLSHNKKSFYTVIKIKKTQHMSFEVVYVYIIQ